ncbi:hypothetical protein NliqN6_0276 [Naganishia liquefaciens]|uniref:BHLH domain-containing protein n=1 Tax=Naganishia liquefaciens TaxID=104408 RepID=A0A8H3YC27_9TREE|nr:hypothetical protein NliqN6_0276 [Naganishia liquefaciens]
MQNGHYYDMSNRHFSIPQPPSRIEYYEAPMFPPVMLGNGDGTSTVPRWAAKQPQQHLYGQFVIPGGPMSVCHVQEQARLPSFEVGEVGLAQPESGFPSHRALDFAPQQHCRTNYNLSPSPFPRSLPSIPLPAETYPAEVIPSSEHLPGDLQQPIHYQEPPFSFVSSAPQPNYDSLGLQGDDHDYLANHDAAVSLPSSSGGLDALLNSPRPIGSSGQPKITGVFTKVDQQSMPVVLEMVASRESTPCRRQASMKLTSARPDSSAPSEASRHCSSPLKAVASSETVSSWAVAGDNSRTARVQAERGRRGALRERFAKLNDLLPMMGQKGSKINVLDRGESQVASG